MLNELKKFATVINKTMQQCFPCTTLVFLFLSAAILPLDAQPVPEIDSLYVYQFEKQTFQSYPLARDLLSPEGIIGESKYGTLNNEIIGDFDGFLTPDTTILHRVADYFDPSDYPFSTAVKLYVQRGDTLAQRCSGIMISDYWIATANHCSRIRQTHHNSWSTDSISAIYASPMFHNGMADPDIGTIAVDKAIFLSGSYFYPDAIFLRLTQPAGRQTGTVAMRSALTSDIGESHTALTFGYPARYFNNLRQPEEYDNIYNGDTLYFSQNTVQSVNNLGIIVKGHFNPGQSGSSVLFFRDGDWSTYGVLAIGSPTASSFSHLDAELSHNIRELMAKIDERTPAGIEEPHTITSIHLKQNYPNPFNASTRIVYEIPQQAHVRLEIFDLLGRRMATLTDEMQSAGRHEIALDASAFPSGVYIYRLQAGEATLTRKMTLVK